MENGITLTRFTDLQGRTRIEVVRRHGQRRPAEVKGLRRLWTEATGMGNKRELYEAKVE